MAILVTVLAVLVGLAGIRVVWLGYAQDPKLNYDFSPGFHYIAGGALAAAAAITVAVTWS